MAELNTACSVETPKDEKELEVEELIENANRLLDSVYRDLNMSSVSSVGSTREAPTISRSRTPPPQNWRDAEIERINRFCETIDLDTPEPRPTTRSRTARIRERIPADTIANDIVDLVNQSVQDLVSPSTATISDVVINSEDEDDDVIIVSSDLEPVADLYMADRQNTHRSRSPLHQRQRLMQTSTTHIQRPQQQRQLHLPNVAVSNAETSKDVSASSSNEGVALSCPVCMESSVKRRPTSTKCGHIFCESCINHAIRITHKCPICNMKLNNKMIFRIYL